MDTRRDLTTTHLERLRVAQGHSWFTRLAFDLAFDGDDVMLMQKEDSTLCSLHNTGEGGRRFEDMIL